MSFALPEQKALKLACAFGFLFPHECYALYAVARSLPQKGRVVNIGVGAGTSSLAIKEANPSLEVFSVDISEGGPFGGMQNEVNAFNDAGMGNLLPYQILGDSKAVGKVWNRGLLDFILVDGDHSYEGCKGDILSWLPHLRPGGVIAFHDYQRDVWPDVQRAVDENTKGFHLVAHVDTLMILRKPDLLEELAATENKTNYHEVTPEQVQAVKKELDKTAKPRKAAQSEGLK